MSPINHLKVLLAALMLCWSVTAKAQIPVTDGAHIGLTTASWAKQVADMLTQYNMLKSQWETAKGTLATLQGGRNIGQVLLNHPAILAQFPPGTLEAVRAISKGGTSGASAAAVAIYREMTKMQCKGTADAITACQATALLSINTSLSVETALTQATQRATQLKNLISQVDSSGDQKASADLQARISAAMTQMQADKQVVDMAIKLQELQTQTAMRHAAELDLQQLTTVKKKCYVCTN